MEFCVQLYEGLNEEQKENIAYKGNSSAPVLQTKLSSRLSIIGENDGEDFKDMADICFVAGPPDNQHTFYSLRHIFEEMSPWFEGQLKVDSPPSQIQVPQVDPEGFRAIFRIAHGLDPNLNVDNVMNVLDAATNFQVTVLVDGCLSLLSNAITDQNVLGVLDTAVKQNIITAAFERECCKVILKASKSVIYSPSFLAVQEELMGRILDCDFLFIDEIDLWRRVILWAKNRSCMERQRQWEDAPEEERDESVYNLEDQITLNTGDRGVIKFKGPTVLGPGIWYGIDLEEEDAKGDGNGTVNGNSYFKASRAQGAKFVRSYNIDSRVEEVKEDIVTDFELTCICGTTLVKIPARECYEGEWVHCTESGESLGREDRMVFHCPRGRIPQHAGGYDLSETVAFSKFSTGSKKTSEKIIPTRQDAKYLRPVLTNIRFPAMPMDYFMDNAYSLLPKQLADSIVLAKMKKKTDTAFKTKIRQAWSTDSISFEVVAANANLEKAKQIPMEGSEAQWSGEKMNAHEGKQWFIMQFAFPTQMTKLDHKNYYQDGDTIKNVEIQCLRTGVTWNEEENEGDNWVDQCTYESAKENSWQKDITLATSQHSRWWKYTVTSLWGTDNNYTCLDELKIYGSQIGAPQTDVALAPRLAEHEYTVVHANVQPGKAESLPNKENESQWSGDNMNTTNSPHFFIFDMGEPMAIGKFEVKYKYQDGDTIKDIELYYLPPGVPLGEDEKNETGDDFSQMGAWVKGGDMQTAKSNSKQVVKCPTNAEARFWKFRVMSLHGGPDEGYRVNNYPCLNWMSVWVTQVPWTTGYCVQEFPMMEMSVEPQDAAEQGGDGNGNNDDENELKNEVPDPDAMAALAAMGMGGLDMEAVAALGGMDGMAAFLGGFDPENLPDGVDLAQFMVDDEDAPPDMFGGGDDSEDDDDNDAQLLLESDNDDNDDNDDDDDDDSD